MHSLSFKILLVFPTLPYTPISCSILLVQISCMINNPLSKAHEVSNITNTTRISHTPMNSRIILFHALYSLYNTAEQLITKYPNFKYSQHLKHCSHNCTLPCTPHNPPHTNISSTVLLLTP